MSLKSLDEVREITFTPLLLRIWYDGVTYYMAERPPAASEAANDIGF